MMIRNMFSLGALVALALAAAPAAASFSVGVTNPIDVIPGNNDFKPQLNGLGLTKFTSTGATISITAPGQVLFSLVAAESGFADTFTVAGGPVSTETGQSWDVNRIFGAKNYFAAATLAANEWFFSTSGSGDTAGIGSNAFGIFLPADVLAGSNFSTNELFIGFDDQFGRDPDDNHDDFIIRATFIGGAPPTGVPEPASWAMMIGGFGLVGSAMRRRGNKAVAA
jgi:PEP-CTERM motif